MSPFPDIKMHGNCQARNDVGIRTLPCRPNLDGFVVCWQHAQLSKCAQGIEFTDSWVVVTVERNEEAPAVHDCW